MGHVKTCMKFATKFTMTAALISVAGLVTANTAEA